jgi:terminase large subunit-like protein
MASTVRLPPGCGDLLKSFETQPLLYNEYQQRFIRARRMRFCLNCKTMGSMDEMGHFQCVKCGTVHDGRWGNLTAPRAFNRFMLLAGRGGGKTLVGALAVLEELMIPGAVWWALGATYKLLHDSTFPTLVGLIPPHFVKRWDADNMEVHLINNSMVAFRSLEDPDRARGPHGVGGFWFDEAAKCPERAWHVATPMLIKAGGIAIATTTPLGFDWTYDQIEKRALTYNVPGYWAAKWKTLDNPMFRVNQVMREQIERDKKMMTDAFFAQEYEAERTNAEGLIYGPLIEKNRLNTDEEIREYIPEWPNIHPSRKVLVGIDEGSDHPFGAVLIVVTERGLVVVAEYLERMKAYSLAHDAVYAQLGLHRFADKTFAANKNALQLRLEWGLKGTGLVQAESKHEVGIQRVQSWLVTGQLKFAYTVPKTIEQMASYRMGENTKPSTGEKKEKENVFKLKDELPDGIRYALMAWPELPDPDKPAMSEEQAKRWNALNEKAKRDIERSRDFRKNRDGEAAILQPGDDGYPMGELTMVSDWGNDNVNDMW